MGCSVNDDLLIDGQNRCMVSPRNVDLEHGESLGSREKAMLFWIGIQTRRTNSVKEALIVVIPFAALAAVEYNFMAFDLKVEISMSIYLFYISI